MPNPAGVGGSTPGGAHPIGTTGAFFFHRASIGLVKQAQALLFSEPEIDRFVMPITSAEAIVRHTTHLSDGLLQPG